MNVTVKITPPDGKWETACEMIHAIAVSSPYKDLNFIVEDVFSTDKPKVNALITNCEFNRNAHCPVIQVHGDK